MDKFKSEVIDISALDYNQMNIKDLGKIIHLPTNPAGQVSTQTYALKELGAYASFCSYYDLKFQYPTDIPSPLTDRNIDKQKKNMLQFAEKCSSEFDIFHFHAGQTFTAYDYSELEMLKLLGKKMIMSYWGSEIRRLSISKQKNPFAIAKILDENWILSKIMGISKYIDVAIVADHESLEYIYGYFKKIYIVRVSIDQKSLIPHYPLTDVKKPIIIHAPSDRYIKGTEYILNAVNNLKKVLDFEFVLIENIPHSEALEWYKKADVVIDQLNLGIYSTVSVEGMALGKPVISYIRNDLKNKYPKNLPIVSATPKTIEKELTKLIKNPTLRYRLGIMGRQYVEKNHHPEIIARKLINIYRNL